VGAHAAAGDVRAGAAGGGAGERAGRGGVARGRAGRGRGGRGRARGPCVGGGVPAGGGAGPRPRGGGAALRWAGPGAGLERAAPCAGARVPAAVSPRLRGAGRLGAAGAGAAADRGGGGGRAARARGGAACGRGAAGVLLCVAGGHRPLLRRADRAAELPAAVCVPWSAGRTGARRLSGGVVRSSREVNRRERWSALRCCRSGGNTSMVIESDVLIIGSGITAAMVAEKLAEERDARIVVVEAGGPATPLEERPARRARYVAYGENPWPGDHVEGLAVEGMASRTMQVGGQAMRWGGVTPRF